MISNFESRKRNVRFWSRTSRVERDIWNSCLEVWEWKEKSKFHNFISWLFWDFHQALRSHLHVHVTSICSLALEKAKMKNCQKQRLWLQVGAQWELPILNSRRWAIKKTNSHFGKKIQALDKKVPRSIVIATSSSIASVSSSVVLFGDNLFKARKAITTLSHQFIRLWR